MILLRISSFLFSDFSAKQDYDSPSQLPSLLLLSIVMCLDLVKPPLSTGDNPKVGVY